MENYWRSLRFMRGSDLKVGCNCCAYRNRGVHTSATVPQSVKKWYYVSTGTGYQQVVVILLSADLALRMSLCRQ